MNNNVVPLRARRGLQFFLQHGDLDAIDGLVPPEGLDPMHMEDLLIPGMAVIPPNFAARIGLNETPITRALASGRFDEAEQLIREVADPEFLNDGAHSATPLALALTGRSSSYGQSRNLRVAGLLVEAGANVNLRIPNHHFETFSESPLELLTSFYLSLLRSFKIDTSNKIGDRRSQDRNHLAMDLLDTIGLDNEENMIPQELITQTRKLLDIFLENGADINLQTTEAGRTIFHMVLAAEVLDQDLVKQMVSRGALVNLTDVHGTTPLMDVIRCKDMDRGAETYSVLTLQGKRLLIDAQNCSGESSLFRSMFYGKNSMTNLLLDEGAASFSMARVQESQVRWPHGRFRAYLHRRPCISNLPSLLAPLLGDSPCMKLDTKHQRHSSFLKSKKFNVRKFNKVVLTKIAPFVDLGWFCTLEVEKTIRELLKAQTSFGHLTNAKVFQEIAIIPLMFGNHSAGLRQRCMRAILNASLFSNETGEEDPKSGVQRLKEKKFLARGQPDCETKPKEWRDSACVIPSLVSDSSNPIHNLETSRSSHSELDISCNTSTPPPIQQPQCLEERRIGENWLLRESPLFEANNSISKSFSPEGIELEVSLGESGSELAVEIKDYNRSENGNQASGKTHETVVRINKMLEETNDMLEKLQTEVDSVQTDSVAKLDQACGQALMDIQVFSEQVSKLAVGEGQSQHSQLRVGEFLPSCSFSSSDLISSSSKDSLSQTDSDTSSGAEENFSFRNVNYDTNSQSFPSRTQLMNKHESVIKKLNVAQVELLAKKLGLPPGLLPCFELEVARLQLGLAVFRHRSINCDRGCEGDDTGSSSDTDSSAGPDSLSEPSLTVSNTDLDLSFGDVDSDLSFEPTVPSRPRILTDSSSDEEEAVFVQALRRHIRRSEVNNSDSERSYRSTSSSSSERRGNNKQVNEEEHGAAAAAAAPLPADPLYDNNWFSFQGGEAEEESTRRYVWGNLSAGFDVSTDSKSSSSGEEEQELTEITRVISHEGEY